MSGSFGDAPFGVIGQIPGEGGLVGQATIQITASMPILGQHVQYPLAGAHVQYPLAGIKRAYP